MKTIKFRVWDKGKNKMLGSCEWGLSLWGMLDLQRFSNEQYQTPLSNWEIMQFTGLYDKNRKEIYEGDIIKFTEADEDSAFGNEETHIVVVTWIEDIAQWRVIYPSGRRRELHLITDFEPVYKCDVIGNIYENPELL